MSPSSRPELLHRGSVKDIYQANDAGTPLLMFHFSDRYSIFDWGEMPDAIPGKGEALALMGAKFFTHLAARGYPTHFVRAGESPGTLYVRPVDVPRDNIAIYQSAPKNILIPLEVIFRFGAPKGSSLLRRFKTEDDWKLAGFDRAYREGEIFNELKIDFTTKLERQDRVLTEVEAQKLSGMTNVEWLELKSKTIHIASEVKNLFAKVGAVLWDGKFEFAFDENRKIILVDSIGLDEMRLTVDGNPLSKELLRQHYLSSEWYAALSRAKETHPNDFKEYCLNVLKVKPTPLPSATISAIASLYQTVAELILCAPEKQAALQERLKASLAFLVRKS